ncbi:MAG: H-type lectin domain-containing protein [Planctomycetota bacterium]|nr:H-type lectin domain-containing protein [Planctomycetota bacterium]
MSDSIELAKSASKHKAATIGKENMLAGVPSDQLEWQGGSVRKTTSSASVNFPSPFKHIPNVVLMPYWIGQGAEVGHVDTLSDVSTTRVLGNGRRLASIKYGESSGQDK